MLNVYIPSWRERAIPGGGIGAAWRAVGDEQRHLGERRATVTVTETYVPS